MDRATCYPVLIALLLSGCPGSGLLDSDGDGISDAEDCAPDDPTRYTGADDPENDGIDQNCDGEDGVFSCDADGDGYAATGCNGNDCDDHDPDVNVGQAEVCDGKDTDCDGELPGGEEDFDLDGAATCEGDCDDADPAFNLLDEDGDGFATCGVLRDCNDHDEALTPADLDFDDYSTCDGDCDDAQGLVHPLADEICDGLDSDCDGEVPEYEADGDGDGYGACADCDDDDDAVWGSDEDGDGFDPCAGDCDETSVSAHPGAFDAWGAPRWPTPGRCYRKGGVHRLQRWSRCQERRSPPPGLRSPSHPRRSSQAGMCRTSRSWRRTPRAGGTPGCWQSPT